MDRHAIAILIPLFGLMASTVLVGIGMLIKHKERMAGLGAAGGTPRRDPELEERMARLEQALETISVEIERTGEAQRYLTKVLAKHLPAEAQDQLSN